MTLNVLGGDNGVNSSMLHLKIGHQDAPDAETSGPSAALDAPTKQTTANTPTFITDVNVITKRLQQAQILEEECKIFDAAALLTDIDPKHYQPIHHDILKEAALFRRLLQDSTSPIIASNTTTKTSESKNNHTNNNNNTNEWIKQGEQHGNRHDFSMYYKVSPTNQITCRLETPIESQLLIPILAVLNESELYPTWIPSFKVPRLEVVKSEKLCQLGRVKQIILVETEVPWPIARRELILKAVACDDIDSSYHHDGNDDGNDDNEDGDEDDDNEGRKDKGTSRILVRIQSLDCEDNGDDGLEILPTKKGVRIKVDGGFVFEKCPNDHPMAKNTTTSSSSSDDDNNLILLTFTFSVDPKLSILPQSVLNFFLRTAMRQIWGMFIHVAEEVGDGKRPAHSEAIERKREVLYDWVEERTNAMLNR